MVHHIVLWNFVSTLSAEEKKLAAKKMKELLEPIADFVEGTVSLQVVTEGLPSSNKEVALISVFETEEALKNYQVHPAHVKAGEYIRSVTCDRACMDFEAE